VERKKVKPIGFTSYLAPKHWPLWFGIGLLRLSVFLPGTVTYRLGIMIGMLIYRFMPERRRVARINLKQAFPNYSKEEIDALNKKAFKNLGVSVFETGTAWFVKDSVLKQRYQVEGEEHIKKAIAKNKPIILLTGHFASMEISGRLIGFHCNKISDVYKKARNPLFNAIMVHYRSIFLDDLVVNKNVRGIIRGLKEGYATLLLPDQDFKRQDIVFTPFLGGIASTLTATAKLAKITDATIIPFYPIRLAKGQRFKLIIMPELKDFPTDDILADSALINKTIEKMVYNNPEQYLWSHKRFKTKPNGRRGGNIYNRKR